MRRKAKSRTRPGSVRIIGGAWRGRRLALPAGPVRPTPDRVRETLFNWLTGDVPGAVCLDLYAGSGALGFEALSRGARHATLVERDPELAAMLERHARLLGAEARVERADGLAYLTATAAPFDIVFVDPPFDQPVAPVLEMLVRRAVPPRVVYVERPAAEGLPELAFLRWRRTSRAGAVSFGIAEFEPTAAGRDDAA